MERSEKIAFCQKMNFDLVIIGGGITGAGIVRDASMRGLNCLLLEKSDFASCTSSNSGKLIHGGLRYIRYLHFKTVFESCQERINLLKKVAPHLVKPVRFLIPFHKTSKTPKFLTMIGLFIYDLLSSFRNISSFKVVAKNGPEIKELGPHFLKNGFKGAVTFYDCFVNDARLTIESIKAAEAFKAINLNYCKVTKIENLAKLKWQVTVNDQLTGESFIVKTSTIISATGAWNDDVLGLNSKTYERFNMQLTSGAHLLIPKKRLQLNHTITVESPINHRNIYFIPWDEMILVGTTDFYFEGDKDKIPLTKKHIDYLLNVINHFFPTANITEKDIESSYIGIRPLIGSTINQAIKIKEEKISRDYKIIFDPNGLLAISGGKLTTYRLMAQKCVDKLCREFFHKVKRADTLQKLPVPSNDLTYIIQNEYVEKLSDLLIRRIPFFYLDKNRDMEKLKEYAQIMGKIKQWDRTKEEAEINDYINETNLKLGRVSL
ncbi:MAG: glycerol-3-phosphate dehydrogenase/oxidase [Bacteriovoracaceae bacterium]